MKQLQRNLSLSLLLILVGCGGAEQGTGRVQTEQHAPVVELTSSPWLDPITKNDIDNFLKIIDGLPEKRVPTFARADLVMEPSEGESLDEYLTKIRGSLRSAIDPAKQGEAWLRERQIAAAFKQMQVNPTDFAQLATKMSMAWSASSVRGEIPILVTQRRLQEELEKLKAEYKNLESKKSTYQEEQWVQAIQETVALSEFLDFVQAVPQASLDTIRANSDRLSRVLPQADLSARFEKFHASSPAVIRVGHAAP